MGIGLRKIRKEAEMIIRNTGKTIKRGSKNSLNTKEITKSATAPIKRTAQAIQLFTTSKVKRNSPAAIPSKIRTCQKANTGNNLTATGKRTAAKTARAFGEPMVLKTAVFAKSKGKRNLPNSCAVPKRDAMAAELKMSKKSMRISSLFEKS
jgi:hypothetical protein